MTPPDFGTWIDTWDDVRRALADFLAVPLLTVLGFIAFAAAMYFLDRHAVGWLEPVRGFLQHHFFSDPHAIQTLLGTIAGAMVTMTSITFSLLLIAVQQSAAALTNQVLDQFLHRHLNQAYFGVFVGVSVYALLTLATNDTHVTRVFGAALALLFTVLALTMLVLLTYTTLNQMRSDRIIEAIHDRTLSARRRQHALLARTRREPLLHDTAATLTVRAAGSGYITWLDLDCIGRATDAATGAAEVVLVVALGDYVSFHDNLAEIGAATAADADAIGKATRLALTLERQRDFENDVGFGVAQLATIGWTSISSAKSNPAPGLAAIRNLRDLLARWVEEDGTPAPAAKRPAAPVPLVYRDVGMPQVIDVLESLMVAASESKQHQCAAEVLRTFALMFERLPGPLRNRAERAVQRGLATLGKHSLTAELDRALDMLTASLVAAGRNDTASAVARARGALAAAC